MGIVFQVPVAILGATRIGIVTPAQLRKNRRYALVVLAFVFFADNQYGKPNPALLTAQWFQAVICTGFLGLMFAEDHYAKQVGKRRVPAQAHGSAGIG